MRLCHVDNVSLVGSSVHVELANQMRLCHVASVRYALRYAMTRMVRTLHQASNSFRRVDLMKPIKDLRVADVVTVYSGSQPFDRDVDEPDNRTFGTFHERSTAEIAEMNHRLLGASDERSIAEIAEAHNHKPPRSPRLVIAPSTYFARPAATPATSGIA